MMQGRPTMALSMGQLTWDSQEVQHLGESLLSSL